MGQTEAMTGVRIALVPGVAVGLGVLARVP
jgi:hypothetical protein